MEPNKVGTSFQTLIHRHRLELYQGIYWAFYFCLSLIKNQSLHPPYPWWGVLLIQLLIMAIIYTIVRVFVGMYVSFWKGALLLTLMFFIYSIIFYFLTYLYLPGKGYVLYEENIPFTWVAFLFTMFLYYYHAMIDAGLLAAIYRVRKKERLKREAQEHAHRMEMRFAMAQVAPHLTHNFLNALYEASLQPKPRLPSAILDFSDVLRYTNKHADKFTREVPLDDEIQNARDVLEVYRFVYPDLQASVHISGDPGEKRILPALLSPLLENVSKHGVYWDPDDPVALTVECRAESVQITCRNRILHHAPKRESTGIGLANLRHRLGHVYPERSVLLIHNDDTHFEIKILIYDQPNQHQTRIDRR